MGSGDEIIETTAVRLDTSFDSIGPAIESQLVSDLPDLSNLPNFDELMNSLSFNTVPPNVLVQVLIDDKPVAVILSFFVLSPDSSQAPKDIHIKVAFFEGVNEKDVVDQFLIKTGLPSNRLEQVIEAITQRYPRILNSETEVRVNVSNHDPVQMLSLRNLLQKSIGRYSQMYTENEVWQAAYDHYFLQDSSFIYRWSGLDDPSEAGSVSLEELISELNPYEASMHRSGWANSMCESLKNQPGNIQMEFIRFCFRQHFNFPAGTPEVDEENDMILDLWRFGAIKATKRGQDYLRMKRIGEGDWRLRMASPRWGLKYIVWANIGKFNCLSADDWLELIDLTFDSQSTIYIPENAKHIASTGLVDIEALEQRLATTRQPRRLKHHQQFCKALPDYFPDGVPNHKNDDNPIELGSDLVTTASSLEAFWRKEHAYLRAPLPMQILKKLKSLDPDLHERYIRFLLKENFQIAMFAVADKIESFNPDLNICRSIRDHIAQYPTEMSEHQLFPYLWILRYRLIGVEAAELTDLIEPLLEVPNIQKLWAELDKHLPKKSRQLKLPEPNKALLEPVTLERYKSH